jgi:hypothetical protein
MFKPKLNSLTQVATRWSPCHSERGTSEEAPRIWPVLVDSLEILRRSAPQTDMSGAGGNLS